MSAIVLRDLRIELRAREAVPAMALLAITIFVLLHFGLDRDRVVGDLAAGVFWMAVLLSAVLGVTRLYAADAQHRLDGLRLAPIDRTAVFVAKAAVLFAFLCIVEVVALAAFAVLLLGASPWAALPWLAAVLVVVSGCLAVIGALVAALAAAAGTRELLLPLLLLPLMVPVMIGAAAATEPLVTAAPEPERLGGWLAMLGLYGGTFAAVGFGVFEELIDE